MLTKGNLEREREKHYLFVPIAKTSMKATEDDTLWMEERERQSYLNKSSDILLWMIPIMDRSEKNTLQLKLTIL